MRALLVVCVARTDFLKIRAPGAFIWFPRPLTENTCSLLFETCLEKVYFLRKVFFPFPVRAVCIN